jgi:hypothetical protein
MSTPKNLAGDGIPRVKMAALTCDCGIAPMNLFFYLWVDWRHSSPHNLSLLSMTLESFLDTTRFDPCPLCGKAFQIQKVWAREVCELPSALEEISPDGISLSAPFEYLRELYLFLSSSLPLDVLIDLDFKSAGFFFGGREINSAR